MNQKKQKTSSTTVIKTTTQKQKQKQKQIEEQEAKKITIQYIQSILNDDKKFNAFFKDIERMVKQSRK